MQHRGMLKKSALIVLIAFILVPAGLASYSDRVAADDLPLKEGPPLPPVSEDYVPDQVIVKFKERALSAVEDKLNRNLGTEVVHTSPRGGF